MAGNPLSKLQKRKRDIQKQIKDLQKELDKILKVESDVLAAVKALPDINDDEPDGTSGSGKPRIRSGPRPAELIKAVKLMLLNAPRPILRGELLQQLAARGIEIQGANPANTLGTTLSRASTTFVNLKGYGYWLRERAFPPADYKPAGVESESDLTSDESQAAYH